MYIPFDCCPCADGLVSHVCAVNLFNGSTALHRAIEFGDNCQLVKALVVADKTCVNTQNDHGLSPLHLACKLGRKKVIELLLVSVLLLVFSVGGWWVGGMGMYVCQCGGRSRGAQCVHL